MKCIGSFDEIESGMYYFAEVPTTRKLYLITVNAEWVVFTRNHSSFVMKTEDLNKCYTIYA